MDITPARYAFGLWGWVTPQGGQAHLPGITSQFKWSDANEIAVSDEQIVAYFHDGSAFYISPSDLLPDSDSDWHTLHDWIAVVPSGK